MIISLIAFLETCLQIDLHLKPVMVRFSYADIPFFGMLLMKDGIKLDPEKVEEIEELAMILPWP